SVSTPGSRLRACFCGIRACSGKALLDRHGPECREREPRDEAAEGGTRGAQRPRVMFCALSARPRARRVLYRVSQADLGEFLLGRWFGPRLPTAMAIVYSATGAGVLILLPASQILIEHFDWRGAYQIFGSAALLLVFPLLLLPWRLFSTGSPHLARSPTGDFA